MKCKKGLIFICLLICLFSIASVCASDVDDTLVASEDAGQMQLSSNNEMTEDNLQTTEDNAILAQSNDDESVIGETDSKILSAGEGNYSDLRADIENGGSLTKSHYRYHDGDGGTIEITTADMIINGNGAVIDMNGSNICAFTVIASGVTIKNLTIKNANYTGDGGAIYFEEQGTVTNCNFTNNQAGENSHGGAVYFSGNGNVTDCNFVNNSAEYSGGAVYFNYYCNGTVSNCNFVNNSGEGGAVNFYSWGTVTDCNFTGNSGDGGAIRMASGVVENCNFVNNSASRFGGAVYISSDGNVTDCNFTNNQAGEYSYGGAVYFDRYGNVTNCNFANNNATVFGGAVYFDRYGNVTNCNFADNTADGGAAVYFDGQGTVSNCNFINNWAIGDSHSCAGAVYFYLDGDVTNCNFTNNKAHTAGAVFFDYEQGTVTNCNFVNNSAYDNGGAVYFYSGGGVTNCNFTNNKATEDNGNSIYWWAGNGIISDSSFIYYEVNGVEVKIDVGNVTISNSRFKSSGGDSSIPPVLGGIIVNCTFSGISLMNPEMTVSAADIFFGENETVTVTLNDDADGEVTFTLYDGDKSIGNFTSDITGGIAECRLSNLSLGVYRINAEYSGDSFYNSTSASAIFIVRPYANITQNAVVGDAVDIAIDLVNATGQIRVFVDGTELFFGPVIANMFRATLSTYDLSYGSHAVTFKYTGPSLDENIFSRWDNETNTFVPYEYEMNLAPIEAIETPDVVDSDDGGIIILRVSDSNSSGTVNVRIYLEGYFEVYREFVVDVVNGIARIDVSDCKDGSYRIVVTYSGDSKHAGFTKESVAVVHNSPSAILANDASMVYTSSSQYYAIVLVKTGKGIAGVSVSFYLNGKYYSSAATNANGVAGIKISKAPGTYKITSSVGTLSITKTLKVTHLLSLKKVSVKKSAKKLVLTATLKKVNGKYLKNKKITFKFKGKKYTAKTNKKGVAKITIKKAVLKKLKVGKKVTYQATYLKDTVKKTVKVKK